MTQSNNVSSGPHKIHGKSEKGKEEEENKLGLEEEEEGEEEGEEELQILLFQ